MSGLQVDIQDIVTIMDELELSINKKMYTRDEVMGFFPTYNKIRAGLDKMKRESIINNLYPEPKPVSEVHLPTEN